MLLIDNINRANGGTGRRSGLKIRRETLRVRLPFRPPKINEKNLLKNFRLMF